MTDTGRTIYGTTQASTPFCVAAGSVAALTLNDTAWADSYTVDAEMGGFTTGLALDDDHGLGGDDRNLVFLPGPGIYLVTASINIFSGASSNLDLAELYLFSSAITTSTYIPNVASASVFLETTRIFRHEGADPRPIEISIGVYTTGGGANNGGTPGVASWDLSATYLGTL